MKVPLPSGNASMSENIKESTVSARTGTLEQFVLLCNGPDRFKRRMNCYHIAMTN
jgi:hypothetical protein